MFVPLEVSVVSVVPLVLVIPVVAVDELVAPVEDEDEDEVVVVPDEDEDEDEVVAVVEGEVVVAVDEVEPVSVDASLLAEVIPFAEVAVEDDASSPQPISKPAKESAREAATRNPPP